MCTLILSATRPVHSRNICNSSCAHTHCQQPVLYTLEMSAIRPVHTRILSNPSCAHSDCQRRVLCAHGLSATRGMHTRNLRNLWWTHPDCEQIALCTLARSVICSVLTSHSQQLVLENYIHTRTNYSQSDGLGLLFRIRELWSQKEPGATKLAGANGPRQSEEYNFICNHL